MPAAPKPPSLFCRTAFLADGWADAVRLHLADGRITAIEHPVTPLPDEPRLGIALPGLVNLHSHAFQFALAGLTERRGPGSDDFWSWRTLMYRFLDRLGPDDVRSITAAAYAAMLEGGYTRVGEFHYLHQDPDGQPYQNPAEMAVAIAAAADETGIALSLLPSFYAHGGFGQPPGRGQIRFVTTLDGFFALMERSRAAIAALPGATLGLAPHSLRAVSTAELSELVRFWRTGPIHIHAAEQPAEVEACLEATHQRPVELLLNQYDIDARWCFIHATHMNDAETAAAAASGATIGLCPLTEANLADGIFPAGKFMARGGWFGIGSDSNIQIDAAAELRQLEYSQRLRDRARNVLADGPGRSTGRSIFSAAAAGGARAVGLPHAALAVGAPADLVVLDDTHPAFAARSGDLILDSWIFAAPPRAIAEVWRDGRCLVRDGRHIRAARIAADFSATLRRLCN